MFPVPRIDSRLRNKAEVLVVRLATSDDTPFAISTELLSQNPVHYGELGGLTFVVLTDDSGASRVYETRGKTFQSWDKQHTVIDLDGKTWELHEDGLLDQHGDRLNRLPSHRAFWFGWYSAHPDTRLIKK